MQQICSLSWLFTMKSAVVVLLVLVACTQSVKFPPNFKKCNRKDPEAGKCYLEAAQDGVRQLTKEFPEINLQSFAPLKVTELNIGAGSEAVVNVDQKFKNCELWGVDKVQLDRFDFDFEKKQLHGSGVIPEVRKECEYELNGKILLLPIVGSGHSTIILKNIKLAATLDFEEVKRKGKTYIHYITNNFTINPDLVTFNFENLFNGNKELGDNINKVLNENHKEVYSDVQKGYEEGLGLILQTILNNAFSKVSEEEAFD